MVMALLRSSRHIARGSRPILNADRTSTRGLFEQMFPGEDPLAMLDAWSASLLGLTPDPALSVLLRRFRERVK